MSVGADLTPRNESFTEEDRMYTEHKNISQSHLPGGSSVYGPDRIVKNQSLIYKPEIRKVEFMNQPMDQMNYYFDGQINKPSDFNHNPIVISKSNKSQKKLAMSNRKNSKFI